MYLKCMAALSLIAIIIVLLAPSLKVSGSDKPQEGQRQWWQKPGFGIGYSVEHQPGWSWDRDFVRYNKEFSDEDGALKFRGPHWQVEEWIKFSKEVGVDFHMAQTKWHDGICFYDTKLTDWKSPVDYVGQFARRSKEAGIPFILYYSVIFDHNPQFDHIQPQKRMTFSYIGNEPEYIEYVLGQYAEIVELYDPDAVWMDWYDGKRAVSQASIEFFRANYPDTLIGFNGSGSMPVGRDSVDYNSSEGHFLYKVTDYRFLSLNVRKELKLLGFMLDPFITPFIEKDEESVWNRSNKHRRRPDHPWDIITPVGKHWQAPEVRDDPLDIVKMAAIVMACGGRANLWGVSQLDGYIRPDHLDQLRMVGDWYRPRKDLFREARTMKYDGDTPPGIGGLPKGYGAIASKLGDDVLIHIIRLEGRKPLTTLQISESDWPGLTGVFLEPASKEMDVQRSGGKITIGFKAGDVDPVDTILRMELD
jgi:hypothetical protein